MGSSSKAPSTDASTYWTSYLAESEPCQFPRLGTAVDGPKRPMSFRVDVEHVQLLRQRSMSDEAALPSLLHVAWGLLLRCYTGLDDVCFGYQEVGLNTAGNRQPTISGPLTGMPAARFTVDDQISVADALEKARGEYISGLPYQDSLPSEKEDSGSSWRQLFDTAVVIRRSSNTAASNNNKIASQTLNVVLPKEVCISALPCYSLLTSITVQYTTPHQAF